MITASSAVEYAFEGSHLADSGETSPSVFTSAIVEGIATGEADTGGTGRICVHELFAYAEEHVRRTNPRQTPHLWSFGTRGDILVARTPLRRVVPALPPVAVQTALVGDRISRLGAVHELSQLLDHDDPSVVLAAVQALGFLVDDDSRSLSEAASTALARIRLTVSPASLEVSAGQQAEVELDGSALAVAARVTSVPDWAHVRQIGNRLLIAASPGTTSRGTITVDGPTGSADIALTATVPEPAPVAAPEPTLRPNQSRSRCQSRRLGLAPDRRQGLHRSRSRPAPSLQPRRRTLRRHRGRSLTRLLRARRPGCTGRSPVPCCCCASRFRWMATVATRSSPTTQRATSSPRSPPSGRP